ncbi:MAG: hypothetical protein LN561_03935 [Rickettsia endosymbiont of Labidopullus appendiculatus]|nr:hypothetical protein [Rickettsia endosymbiont of Labidopullus appendiculatus]
MTIIRNVLLFSVLLTINYASFADLPRASWHYDITYINSVNNDFGTEYNGVPHLRVKAIFKNAVGTYTKFYLPYHFLGGGCLIQNLGQFVIAKDYHKIFNPEKCTLEVFHPNNEDIILQYNIVTSVSSLVPHQSPFGSVITEDFFHFVGTSLFLVSSSNPNNYHEEYYAETDVSISWYLPKLNKISNIYGFKLQQNFTTNQYQLTKNSYMGGKISITPVSKKIILSTANLNKLSNFDLKIFFKNSFPLILKLWDEELDSDYVINIIESNDYPIDDGMFGVGGPNSLGAFVYNVKQGLKNRELTNILIHEIIHKWIVGKIDLVNETWFNEGFTDYFAHKINLLTFKDLNEHIKWHNKVLKYYYTVLQPMQIRNRNVTNLSTFASPYFWGYLLASNINHLIKTFDNNFTLEYVMRSLNKDTEHSTKELQLVDFLKVLEKYKPGISRFVNSALEGKIQLSAFQGELGKCVKLNYLQFKEADYGIDYLETINRMVISGVRKNSRVYNAGIRNGHKVLKVKFIQENMPELPLKLNILTDQGIRTIIFHRQGKLITVPQFQLDDNLYKQNPERCLEYFRRDFTRSV